MAKKILQVFLVIIFIILVVCGIILGSYVFSSPNTDPKSDSRLLISGAWQDTAADKKLVLDENGNFTYSELKSGETIADGYYRINEDRKTIKLFMFPGHFTDAFKDHVNLFFFAQISYSDLKNTTDKDLAEKTTPAKFSVETEPKCTFLIKNASGNDGVILNAIMPERTLDLYSKGKKFSAKNK